MSDTVPRQTPDVAAAYDIWADTYDTPPNKTRTLAGEVLRIPELTW